MVALTDCRSVEKWVDGLVEMTAQMMVAMKAARMADAMVASLVLRMAGY